MIVIGLDMEAYHQLEKLHYVTVSESGHRCQPRDTRARYYIYVDSKDNYCKCKKYTRKRNEVNDFILDKKPHFCRANKNFKSLTEYFARSNK